MPEPDKIIYALKDLTSLTRWAKGLLVAGIVLSVIGIFSTAVEYELLGKMERGAFQSQAELMKAAESSDARQQFLSYLYLVWFLITAIVVLMWIYRANNNLHALGAKSMRFTPGWAVGWWRSRLPR